MNGNPSIEMRKVLDGSRKRSAGRNRVTSTRSDYPSMTAVPQEVR